MIGICKFCGCTEDKPCVFRALDPEAPAFELWPCAWLLPDVCTNPACVDKAYFEAVTLVARLYAEAA